MHQWSTLSIGFDVHQASLAVASVAKDPAADGSSLGTMGTRRVAIATLVRTLHAQATHHHMAGVIRAHMDVLVATDFFTTKVWTWCGLVTYDVRFFIRIGTREVHVAGVTPPPDQRWMTQMARNMTMVNWDFLSPGPYLIHDRDGKYCPAFQQAMEAVGVKPISLPPRSPNLNAYAERWIRSVQVVCCDLQSDEFTSSPCHYTLGFYGQL